MSLIVPAARPRTFTVASTRDSCPVGGRSTRTSSTRAPWASRMIARVSSTAMTERTSPSTCTRW